MISRRLSMLLVHDLGSNMENKKKNMKLKLFWLISIVVRHKIYATGDITDANITIEFENWNVKCGPKEKDRIAF